MKTAIIGAGKWGKNLIKEFDKQTEVVWCCHKSSEETRKFLEENYSRIKSTVHLEDILDDAGVEAVAVATPIPTHFEIAKKVLGSGKHLFLEKPGCSKSSELEELCAMAEKNKLALAVGYEFPHHPAWKKIGELIPKGNIRHLQMEWFKWGTFQDSAVTNLLCHDISLLESLRGKLKITRQAQNTVITDSDILKTEFDCGDFSASSHINRASPEKRKTVSVMGEKETYIWNNNDLFKIDFSKKALQPVETDNASPVAEEIKDFIESVNKNGEPLTGGGFALKVWEALESLSRTAAPLI